MTEHGITGHHRVQPPLDLVTDQWQRTFDAIGDLIAIIDPQHRILRVNRAMAKRLGRTPEQCLGLTCCESVHGLDAPPSYCPHAQTLADGREHMAEVYERRLGGYFLITCTPLFDEQGRMLGTVHVARDITQRKRMEEDLRRSESLLAQAGEMAHLGAWEIEVTNPADLSQNQLRWSDEVYRIFGYEPGAVRITNDLFFQHVPPDDRPRIVAAMADALARQRPYQIEHRIICTDGAERIVFEHADIRFDAQGRPVQIIGAVQDITEQEHAQEALRQLKEQAERAAREFAWLAEIPQENPDPILRVSTDFVILYGNPAAGALFGGGGRAGRKVPPPVQEVVSAALADATVLHREITWEARTLWLTVAPFPADGYISLYVKDITARKRMEAELQEWSEHLELEVAERTEELTQTIDQLYEEVTRRVQAEEGLRQHAQTLEERAQQLQKLTLELSQAEDRERQRLAEILHDDLQQLLAAAKFRLGMLNNRLESDHKSRKMAGMVKDLLQQAIDRSRSLSHELSPPALAYSDLQETFVWLAGQLQAKHGLTVQVQAFSQIKVHSQPLKAFLYKAAQEMLFNVVKHADVKEAQLRLRRRRGYIYLTVADKGRGYAPQAPDKTGFGLLSIRERVSLLGGRVRVRSAPGKGCIFVLTVPDTEPPKTEEGGHKTEDRAQKTGEKTHPSAVVRLPSAAPLLRVLLVDDHRIVRQGIEAMLAEASDIEVVGQADNGREAVDLAQRLRPEVIVMDVAMPVMAGDEATRRIKQHLPHIRVIALSMFDDARVADQMRRAGAAAYLLKTAPAQELLAAIRGRAAITQEA